MKKQSIKPITYSNKYKNGFVQIRYKSLVKSIYDKQQLGIIELAL